MSTGEDGGEGRGDVGLGEGGRSDVEKDLRFRLEARVRRVAAEECAGKDSGRKVARDDRSVIGSRTCGTCGETVLELRRKEMGTGEPDSSTVMLSHAGGSSLLDIVVALFALSQPAASESFITLPSKFSQLVVTGASYMESWGDG